MTGYYENRLSAERLRQCYAIAPPRVQQYLRAEVDYVAGKVRPNDHVLELGCGYGRAMGPLADRASLVVGIDTSHESLRLARQMLHGRGDCRLLHMDALRLTFDDDAFDVVVCIQNGLSAFGVDQQTVVNEAVRVTRPGGRALFSTYAESFWPERLEWFRLQSEAGLLGEIDWSATGNGVIVCKDGFRATTLSVADFDRLAAGAGVACYIDEVDESSVFCEMRP